jgi:uncharacterized protein YpuA (DUF1002 family)
MKFLNKKIFSVAFAFILLMATGITALAADDSKPYLALGADLTETEKATVLEKLGVAESDLANYNVITITNEDERII